MIQWPDRLILNAELSADDNIRWPLHVASMASANTAVRKSFGSRTGERFSGDANPLLTPLARPLNGTFWGSETWRYLLTHWDADGKVLGQLERRPEWFPPARTGWWGNPGVPPDPNVGAIALGGRDTLWVFVRVPGRDWRDAWPAGASRSSEIAVDMIEQDKLFDTMIEVIDVAAGRVIARRLQPGYLVSALPGARAVFGTASPDGAPLLSVVQLAVSRR